MSRDVIDRGLRGLNELGAALSELSNKWEESEALDQRNRKAQTDLNSAEMALAQTKAKCKEADAYLAARNHELESKGKELAAVQELVEHSRIQDVTLKNTIQDMKQKLGMV